MPDPTGPGDARAQHIDPAALEAVARAMAKTDGIAPDDLVRDSHGELMPLWTIYKPDARAALLALREYEGWEGIESLLVLRPLPPPPAQGEY